MRTVEERVKAIGFIEEGTVGFDRIADAMRQFAEDMRDECANYVMKNCWNDAYTQVNQRDQALATVRGIRSIKIL